MLTYENLFSKIKKNLFEVWLYFEACITKRVYWEFGVIFYEYTIRQHNVMDRTQQK